MSIRRKALLLVVSVFVVSLIVLYTISTTVLLPDYHPLEEQPTAHSVRVLFGLFIIVGLGLGMIVMAFIEGLVLRRLTNLSRALGQISRSGNLSSRVRVEGNDELSKVGESINGLIASLDEATQERAILQKRVLQSQKSEAVGRLAGGIAHDFNNILTAVMGYCGLLARSQKLDADGRHTVAELEQLAERAATLTRQLLAFGRRQVLQPRVLDLNTVIDEIQNVLPGLVGENIAIELRPAATLACVRADPEQIEQVIINLTLNAREAMPQGGELLLETYQTTVSAAYAEELGDLAGGEYSVLSLTDSGVGMSDDVKAHLFEPFFTTKEVGKGSGLGLATCYGIVKQSGGHLEVESAPGQGTTVRMFLPSVSDQESRTAKPAAACLPAGDGTVPHGTETVLVAEDELAVRQMSAAILRDLGYQVIEAGDGEEALTKAAAAGRGTVDLLLTDIVMPRVGGRELAAELGARDPQTKVLFMSGYSELATEHGGMLNEQIEFMQKPFTSNMLAHKVRAVLDAPSVAGGT